jgi:hypothetical protein
MDSKAITDHWFNRCCITEGKYQRCIFTGCYIGVIHVKYMYGMSPSVCLKGEVETTDGILVINSPDMGFSKNLRSS